MLVDQPLPNVHGGVSQQPPQSRYLNQVDAQVNCIADPVRGLSKRPPSEHVRKIISGSLTTPPVFFKVDRDSQNRFVGMVENGTARVFDVFTGTEQTVTDNTTVGSNYLSTATPKSDITTLTVADYTYIVNRSVTVEKLPALTPTRDPEGIVFVRASNYDRTYTLTVTFKDGSGARTATYTTQDGSDSSHTDSIRTTNIAAQLQSQLTAHLDTVELIGSVIYIQHSVDFTLSVEDDQGNQAMKAFKDSTQRFSDLPEKAKEGVVLRVAGDNTSAFDDYYVSYTAEGVWEEVAKPGITYQLDATTMPVALIRQPDNTFTLEEIPWVDRQAGDDDSCPFPSFVDFKLNGMFYFRNRLGFLADENVVLSKAGDYFNFFRTTATQLLDDDPIDTPASDASGENSPVSILRHAVAFDKKLVLFSDNAQFIMTSKGYLTPFEAEVDPVTSFACAPNCRPTSQGRYVYFAFDRDGASGVRQFYVDNAAQTEDAQEVTGHVPTYLPSNLVSMSGTTLENIILALSTDTPNKVYVYEYYFSGADQLQSSWGLWEFHSGNNLHFAEFFENVAYIVTERSDGFHLERIRLRPDLTDVGLEYYTCLDHRVSGLTGIYDAINNRTEYTLPYEPDATVKAYSLSNVGVHAPGIGYTPESVSGTTVRLSGNTSGHNVAFGLQYEQLVSFSRPYYMQNSQNGLVANTQAILKVRDFSVDYAETGYFNLTFNPTYRTGYTKVFSGQILGSDATDYKPLDDGAFRIKTPTKNLYWGLTLSNDSPFPCRILSASWRGVVESKSQRV